MAKINFSGLWAVGISYVCGFLHSLNVSFWTFKFFAQWISQQAQRSPIQRRKTWDPLNRDKNKHLLTAVMTRCVVGGRYQDFMPEKSKVSHRGCPPDTVSLFLQTHFFPSPFEGLLRFSISTPHVMRPLHTKRNDLNALNFRWLFFCKRHLSCYVASGWGIKIPKEVHLIK